MKNNYRKIKGFHMLSHTKTMFLAGKTPVLDGLWGPGKGWLRGHT